jgi:hypothetical protein
MRVYDDVGNVIETHEHAADFKEWFDFRKIPLKRDLMCAVSTDITRLFWGEQPPLTWAHVGGGTFFDQEIIRGEGDKPLPH